ncbi:hypothetical protein EAG08_03920 [Chryseobacterium sp. 3008163]|nr:hypothetical protein EAG08_03920 [Chryseobacterium sp. 3008163]
MMVVIIIKPYRLSKIFQGLIFGVPFEIFIMNLFYNKKNQTTSRKRKNVNKRPIIKYSYVFKKFSNIIDPSNLIDRFIILIGFVMFYIHGIFTIKCG